MEKILVVEGHSVYINKLEGFLKGLTFDNFVLARSGKEGIDLVKTESPDIIIVSSFLPDIDGLDFCRQVCQILEFRIKIIVLCGLFEDEERINRFKEMGATDVLDKKEKDMSDLQATIEKYLSRQCLYEKAGK